MGLGRKVERVANTPSRRLPPRRGGRTVGCQRPAGMPWKTNTSHKCEKPSRPRTAAGWLYGGSSSSVARAAGASPGWRGMPNFSRKQEWTMPIGANRNIYSHSDFFR